MTEPLDLTTATIDQRINLRPQEKVRTADGKIHIVGTVTYDREDATGTVVRAAAYSLSADHWINLLGSRVAYRITGHHQPDGQWCRWSMCAVAAPEERTIPGNRRCPADCPDSDVENAEGSLPDPI